MSFDSSRHSPSRHSPSRLLAVAVTAIAISGLAAPNLGMATPEGRIPMPGEDGAGRTPRVPRPDIPPPPRPDIPPPPRPDVPPQSRPSEGRAPEPAAKPAESPAETIDRALAGLAAAPDAASAAPLRALALSRWRVSGSPTADLLITRAEAAVAGGDTGLASDLFDAAIVVAPTFVAALHERAVIHLLREETTAAIGDLRAVLVLEPRHFPALSMLSALMESLDRKGEALDLLRRAAAIDPHGEGTEERLKRLVVEVEGREL